MTSIASQDDELGLSLPHENVLLVPGRNVRLTRSGWGVGSTGSFGDDTGRTGSAGGAEEGTEEADYAEAGCGGVGGDGAAGAALIGAAWPAGMGCGGYRPDLDSGYAGLNFPAERRAKSARRSFAFSGPRPPLGDSTTLIANKQKPPESLHPGGFALPISPGASPVASALGLRSGATPRGHLHHNPISTAIPLKPDISTWQRTGHFYLALTQHE